MTKAVEVTNGDNASSQFAVGDKVRCIDASNQNDLREGVVYTVDSGIETTGVIWLREVPYMWNVSRFEKVPSLRSTSHVRHTDTDTDTIATTHAFMLINARLAKLEERRSMVATLARVDSLDVNVRSLADCTADLQKERAQHATRLARMDEKLRKLDQITDEIAQGFRQFTQSFRDETDALGDAVESCLVLQQDAIETLGAAVTAIDFRVEGIDGPTGKCLDIQDNAIQAIAASVVEIKQRVHAVEQALKEVVPDPIHDKVRDTANEVRDIKRYLNRAAIEMGCWDAEGEL